MTETYKFKRPPYKHQREALVDLLKRQWGGALLMEPRTGKTKVSVDFASVLHQKGRVNRVLVTCPLVVIKVWEDSILADCPFPFRIVVWDKRRRKRYRSRGLSGLPNSNGQRIDFVIVNHDAFATPGKRVIARGRDRKPKLDADGNVMYKRVNDGGRYTVLRDLRRWQPDLIIVDESHRFKNPSAKKTRTMVALCETVPHRVICTGTVQTKKKRLIDVYSQWRFLNPTNPVVARFPTQNDFKDFAVMMTRRNGYPEWLRNNPRPARQVHEWLHRDAYSVTRAECFDLPPREADRIVDVELTGRTADAYVQMAEEMIAQIETGEITEASVAIVKALRLRQLTGGVAKTTPTAAYPVPRLVRIGREKLDALEDILGDLFEQDEKVVIAADFRVDLLGIGQLVQKKMKQKVWVLVGGQKREARDAKIEAFRRHDGPGVFAVQPSAGGMGIDLSTAGTFIWYSLTRSWVDFTQCEDRIALNPRGTQFIYLQAMLELRSKLAATIDNVVLDTLHGDGKMGRAIMKNPRKLLDFSVFEE